VTGAAEKIPLLTVAGAPTGRSTTGDLNPEMSVVDLPSAPATSLTPGYNISTSLRGDSSAGTGVEEGFVSPSFGGLVLLGSLIFFTFSSTSAGAAGSGSSTPWCTLVVTLAGRLRFLGNWMLQALALSMNLATCPLFM